MNLFCHNWLFYFFLFITGICFGSFLNVLIYRIPKGENIAYPPSHCPKCSTKLKPWHNIPIISYILLKGKCAYCKTNISIQYPFIEFLSGILILAVYKITGCSLYFIPAFFSFWLLLGLSVIDIKYKAVPDSLNLLALTFAFFSSPDIIGNIKSALLFVGFLSLLRYYVSYFKNEEALGEADIIIGGTMGALLGVKYAFIALFISSLAAIPFIIYITVKKGEKQLPFIPFLVFGTLTVFLFKEYISSYLNYY